VNIRTFEEEDNDGEREYDHRTHLGVNNETVIMLHSSSFPKAFFWLLIKRSNKLNALSFA
jgi:hypothetical protein